MSCRLNSNVICRLGKYGDIQPIGSSQGTVNVGGTSWNLWYGPNGSMQVYSFVAPGNLTNWSGDVKNFYTYLQNNKGYPASSQYVLSMSLQHLSYELPMHDN
jgi:xyloglucan-specific endo-beta-1,4-glucanase